MNPLLRDKFANGVRVKVISTKETHKAYGSNSGMRNMIGKEWDVQPQTIDDGIRVNQFIWKENDLEIVDDKTSKDCVRNKTFLFDTKEICCEKKPRRKTSKKIS